MFEIFHSKILNDNNNKNNQLLLSAYYTQGKHCSKHFTNLNCRSVGEVGIHLHYTNEETKA